jgi:beta-phosphoglucomutase
MLKAIFFDLDGTLIDSEHFYFDCWNEILAEVGAQLTFHDWVNNYAGFPLLVNAQKISEKYGLNEPYDKLVERREKLTLERFKTIDVKLMPFALETLNFFRDKGLMLAIATSSIRKDVETIFERNGFNQFFNLVITRSDVTNGKPHPECYLTCCEQLNVNSDECIVFEDTVNGLTSAKAAGLTCYAIQSNTEEHQKLKAADKIFLNLKEAVDYLLETRQV